MIVNASYNANQVPSDKKSICQYVKGLIVALLWSIGWCILDTHNEWHLFPPIEFCLSKPYEFSLNSFLLFQVWNFPLIMFLTICVRLSWKLYIHQNEGTFNAENLKKLSFNSLLLSSALFMALVALYPSLVSFDLDLNLFAISSTLFLLLADLLKIPFQLMFTFQDNSNTQRQTRETRRQTVQLQEVVERLNQLDDQPDFFELEEYDGDKESCSNVYIKCFDEPRRRSNLKDSDRSNRLSSSSSSVELPSSMNLSLVKDVPEDTNSDLNLAILCPTDPGTQFIDEDVESVL